jgi:hypothetical protein
MLSKPNLAKICLIFLLVSKCYGQQAPQNEHGQHPAPPQAQHEEHSQQEGMQMPNSEGKVYEAGMFLMKQASGTGVNPDSSQAPMWMTNVRSWNLMFHSSLFLNELQQSGARGADKFFSTNWVMGMAERRIGSGSFMARAMLSLDPLTVTKRRYPLLFQTGETAFGKGIIDAQHPHDFLMEFSLQYARPLSDRTMFSMYFAPVGDPALGPVAFPHRVSAMELPQATLGHHVQDSTHIANEVITVGLTNGPLRLEASGFHGAEPNENRWNVDYGAMDSWSTRVVFAPQGDWSGQVSVGRLTKPEALEDGDIVRATASATYNRLLKNGFWASSFVWGRNHKTDTKRNTNSFLGESLLQFSGGNYLTGRIEAVDKDELFDEHAGHSNKIYRILAYTVGYSRNLLSRNEVQIGLGSNFTFYSIPDQLATAYGAHPIGVLIYFRLRTGTVH